MDASTTRDAAADLQSAEQRLVAILKKHTKLLVAYSGGVDSAYLLHAALAALGSGRVLAVTGRSESLARVELEGATQLATQLGATHRIIETRELEDPRYAANPSNRCYYCKSTLYDALFEIAAREGYDAVADGTNRDDTRDVRPGRQAARERGVVSPLLEAGLGKTEIRLLSQGAGLPTWDKPEMPCLSSRIPYGTPVDAATLSRIEAAEAALRACGVRGGRVRHHGDVARIELPPEDLGRLAAEGFRDALIAGVRRAGYAYVCVDLEGYRKGRLNEAIPGSSIAWRKPPGRSDLASG